jgi:hypothetical protein
VSFAETFRAVCAELTELVYQLNGLETAYGYFETSAQVHADCVEHPEIDLQSQVSDSNAVVPTDYPFNPSWALNYSFESGGHVTNYVASDQIRLAFESAWRPSTSDLVSHATLIIQSDIPTMAPACESLGDTAAQLYDFTRRYDANSDTSMPAFVQHLQASWASLSGSGFYDFYEDLTDVVYRYFDATLRQATTSACVTNAIDQYQRNILEAAENSRELAKDVLRAWQQHDRPIEVADVDTVDKRAIEILDGVSLATGVAATVPGPQAVALGGISLVTDIMGFVATDVLNKRAITLATGGEIHDNLAAALDEAQNQMLDALDALRTGNSMPGGGDDSVAVPAIPFDQFVKDAENNAGWKPPTVDFS